MTDLELKQLTDGVIALSKNVGAFLLAEQNKITASNIERKGANNLVSYADQQAEQMFVTGLAQLLPAAGFIAEEGTGIPSNSGLNWIIDPLDGTTNYLHQIPFWCTSVALVQNNEPLVGVIFDPMHNELFAAYGHQSAELNGKQMYVSPVKYLKDMLIVTGFPYDDRGMLQKNLKAIEEFSRHSRGIRRLGSAALDMAYVACGRFDGFYEYGLNPWDVAAGTLLVRNSGGRVDDFRIGGNPIFGEEIIAASNDGFIQIQEIVAQCFSAQ
jgi:myo-inositol-1(or 4)-monophosphatase